MKKIVLDFDDWSVLGNRFDLLLRLREHYPQLKVSLFAIPFDARFETDTIAKMFREKAVKTAKENLDWIQLIPHGLTHIQSEFKNADKTTTQLALKAIDDAFKKDGLPYEKGFKAPFWEWNQDVVDALDKEGWWGAVDPRQTDMLKTKKFYRHEFSIAEPYWLSEKDVWKLHGHMDSKSDNDFEECFIRLFKMPSDAEFRFVTDYLEEV